MIKFCKIWYIDHYKFLTTVYENFYGVPKFEITNNLEKNNKVLIRVDVQGAKRLKEILNHSVFIFISPESKKDLKNRLTLRHENSENDNFQTNAKKFE